MHYALTARSWHCKCAGCRGRRKSPAPAACAGTVTHMPPELLMNGILTKAADVYAFGVLLCECSYLPVPVQACCPLSRLHVACTLLAAHGSLTEQTELWAKPALCGVHAAPPTQRTD